MVMRFPSTTAPVVSCGLTRFCCAINDVAPRSVAIMREYLSLFIVFSLVSGMDAAVHPKVTAMLFQAVDQFLVQLQIPARAVRFGSQLRGMFRGGNRAVFVAQFRQDFCLEIHDLIGLAG